MLYELDQKIITLNNMGKAIAASIAAYTVISLDKVALSHPNFQRLKNFPLFGFFRWYTSVPVDSKIKAAMPGLWWLLVGTSLASTDRSTVFHP